MTDYVALDDVQVIDEKAFGCRGCDKSFTTTQGRKVHESRMHGIKPNKTQPTANSFTADDEPAQTYEPPRKPKPGIGKRPLISTSTKLSATGKDITLDLAAAAIAWGAIRYVMSTGVQITKKEQEDFILPDKNREKMFRPFTDLFEQFTPGVRIMNTIAERFDYIECAMLWKQYRNDVMAYADAKKEEQGVTSNGPARQSNGADNAPPNGANDGNNGYGEFGEFIPNGFGNSFQA